MYRELECPPPKQASLKDLGIELYTYGNCEGDSCGSHWSHKWLYGSEDSGEEVKEYCSAKCRTATGYNRTGTKAVRGRTQRSMKDREYYFLLHKTVSNDLGSRAARDFLCDDIAPDEVLNTPICDKYHGFPEPVAVHE